jgi:hypothetical protein
MYPFVILKLKPFRCCDVVAACILQKTICMEFFWAKSYLDLCVAAAQ